MRTTRNVGIVVSLILGLCSAPMVVWAAEHGGKEHAGSSAAPKASTSSKTQTSSKEDEPNEASVMREAAAALRKGEVRPDLADKLEKLAAER